ncbi:isopenicillin N synthase family dioxygenase [Gordonia polyisoprenivorans]|uniref:isopenicillin N synthase family dioxygenase n=1 Tax=Gordonia polyisoprenivorans TaxID=84595 RepID=UPI001AD631A9|nr:isopenicillin N synthase family oxygenase [Gordonia polyisoprenivorans]QTI70529.1 isopenicillin N synthase family oxygenase [Gordonia polyisoprenivorans]
MNTSDHSLAPSAEYRTTAGVDDTPSEGVFEVEVVDISLAVSPTASAADVHSVATTLLNSFTQTGFAVVTGHGINESAFADMCTTSTEFFALPREEKMSVGFPAPEIIRGYEPVPEAAEGARTFNAMESFLINRIDPVDDFATDTGQGRLWRWPNLWPERPEDMRQVWETYYRAMDALGARLLELIADAYDLPQNTFTAMFDRHFSNLAYNNYPPRDAVAHDDIIPNGTHTDHGALTLLYRPSEPGGLEVYAQGHWWVVPWIENSLVLNVGDVLEFWTGGRLTATPHRVTWSSGANAGAGRQSVVFFQQPNPDAPLTPVPGLAATQTPSTANTSAGMHISRKELGQHTLDALGV